MRGNGQKIRVIGTEVLEQGHPHDLVGLKPKGGKRRTQRRCESQLLVEQGSQKLCVDVRRRFVGASVLRHLALKIVSLGGPAWGA